LIALEFELTEIHFSTIVKSVFLQHPSILGAYNPEEHS